MTTFTIPNVTSALSSEQVEHSIDDIAFILQTQSSVQESTVLFAWVLEQEE